MRRLLLSAFSHRTLALIRWDLHFLRVRLANALTGTRGRIRRHIASLPAPLFLNLGSGPRGMASPHWVNVDGYRDKNVHYLLDLSRPLPIPDASFDGIFCEHVLEHFDLTDGIALLHQCHRVLRPGGTVRIIMPDADRIIHEYVRNPGGLAERRLVETGIGMDAVNSYFRQRYEHHCLYDFDLARHALDAAGFGDIERVGYRSGRRPELLLDDAKYEWESIYLEASKPYSR